MDSTIKQIDIYRTLHPIRAGYKFFPSAYGIFTKIDYILGHIKTLNKLKRIEIIKVHCQIITKLN